MASNAVLIFSSALSDSGGGCKRPHSVVVMVDDAQQLDEVIMVAMVLQPRNVHRVASVVREVILKISRRRLLNLPCRKGPV